MLDQLPTANARLRQEKMQRRDENQRLQELVEQVSIQMHDLERTYEQGQPQQQQPSFQRWVCQKDEESPKEERQETRRANRPSSLSACLPAFCWWSPRHPGQRQ